MIKPKSKPSNKSSFQHVRRAIRKITDQERLKLFKELNDMTIDERFRQAVERIRARFKKNPVPKNQLNKIIEDARKEYYAERHR